MHCPGGNATDPIWTVLASSDRISHWTPLKPPQNNPNLNPNPLVNQLWCIDCLTPPTPLIIPHRLPAFLESLMPHKNWYSLHARCSKSCLKHSIRFCGFFFPSFQVQVALEDSCRFIYIHIWFFMGNKGTMNNTFTLKYFTDRDKWFSFWSLLLRNFIFFSKYFKAFASSKYCYLQSPGIYILIVQGYFPSKFLRSLFYSSFPTLLVRNPEFN